MLDSDALNDRCGKCNGDGDTCFVVKANYTTPHTEKGNGNFVFAINATDADFFYLLATRITLALLRLP